MVHLHVRSAYSLLHSPFRISRIIEKAKEENQNALVVSDLETMHGAMEFYHAAQKAGIKPILGLETLVLTKQNEPLRLQLLAKNDQGLQNLYAYCSKRNDQENPLSLDELASYLQDIIVIALGIEDVLEANLTRRNEPAITEILNQIKSISNDFYTGISMNDSKLRADYNLFLKELSARLSIPSAAISYILYEKAEDVEDLKILRAIEKGTLVTDSKLDVSYNRYFRSETEMHALYDEADLLHTERIAEKIQIDLAFRKSGLPQFVNKYGLDSRTYLQKLCYAGLKKRMNGKVPKSYRQRLDYELDVIGNMSYNDYFLIVWDFIRYGRSQNIMIGPGRGSAAGSLVAYCLGITHIDPMKYGLLFERFLNPERVSLPDIDTDVPDDRREEIIQYLYHTYGTDRTCQIVTYSNMKAKSVIRDIGRVKAYPIRLVDSMCKLIPSLPGTTLKSTYDNDSRFRRLISTDKQAQDLYVSGLKLEGLPRHTSIHAGGVVLSDQPVEKVCPTMRVDESVVCTQFGMNDLEALGLIKMDILALRNLTIIDGIVRNIEKNEGIKIDILKIDLNDSKTYDLLKRADTVGVFQLESDGIKNLLLNMKPYCFEDIAAVIALYRPGPMQNINTYLERRRDPGKIRYLHPLLEPILKETYGIIVYQEQTMQIARAVGGFSLGQADLLRKAMSKKKKDVMDSFEKQFIEGAVKNGVELLIAKEIFGWMERFASYGFNKSHAFAYGLIVYQMAWLKSNYPLYFYQSLLNSVIGSEIKSGEYIYECSRAGIEILPVDVTKSTLEYRIENGKLRMPIHIVKGIGKAAAMKIVKEREEEPFENLYNFIARMLYIKTSEANLKSLVMAGGLDSFGYSRESLLKYLSQIMNYCRLITVENQGVLFDYDVVSPPAIAPIKDRPMVKSQHEFEVYGFYISEHPIQSLRRKYFSNLPVIAQALNMNGYMQLVGRISNYKVHKTKKGDLMCFITLEDETQKIDAVVMPKLFMQHREKIDTGRFLFINGRKDKPGSILVNQMQWIEPDV